MRTDGWADRQTAMTKLIIALSVFRTLQKIHLLPCGHKHDVPPCSERFTTTAVQFFSRCSCSIIQVAQRCRHWRNVNPIFHKALQKEVQGIRYGDRGRGCGPSRPNHLSGNCLLNTVVTSLWTCGGALSYYASAFNSEQFHDQCLQSVNSRMSYGRLGDKRGTVGT